MARGSRTVAGAAALALLAALGLGGFWLWRTLPPTSGLVGTPQRGPSAAPGPLPAAIQPGSLEGIPVAVLREAETVRVTPPGFYDAEVAAWKELLESSGARLVGPGQAAALVVPWGACLGVGERNLIVRHLAGGGGVVAVGPTGYGDRVCAGTADTLLYGLVGGRAAVAELGDADGSRYGIALGETTLAAGVPPGARIEIRPAARQFVFRAGSRDVYYGDFLRNPVPRDQEPSFDAAIARTLVGEGRAVTFGFALTHTEPGWSRDVAARVAVNAVRWAAGRPVSQLASWPHGARAGVVVAQDVQSRPEDVRNVAAAATEVPVTFYVAAPAARRHADAMRAAARSGEVAVRPAEGDRLEEGTEARRERLLRDARAAISGSAEAPVVGFHTGGGVPDARTLEAWRAAGGEYVYGTSDLRTAGPEIVPLGADSIVLIARATPDDFHYLSVDGVRDRGELVGRFLGDLARVAEFRGLYVLGTHTHTMGRSDLLPAFVAVLDEVAGDSTLWSGTVAEAAAWWRARDAAAVRSDDVGQRRVEVVNRGRGELRDAVLLVDRVGRERAVVAVPTLAPGESFQVILEASAPDPAETQEG